MESIYVFTLLNILDVMTTKSALEKGGIELNPIGRYIIHKMGVTGMFILKYISMSLVIIAGYVSGNLDLSLWVNNILLSIVVGWNSYVNYVLAKRKQV